MNMPAQPTCTCMLSLHTVPESYSYSYSYSYLVLTPYLWITHPLVASSRCRKTAVGTSSERMPASVKCCSSVLSHVLLSTNRAAPAQFTRHLVHDLDAVAQFSSACERSDTSARRGWDIVQRPKQSACSQRL